jgi:hypothetical protein
VGRPIWNSPTCRRRRRWPSRNPDSTTWPNLPKKQNPRHDNTGHRLADQLVLRCRGGKVALVNVGLGRRLLPPPPCRLTRLTQPTTSEGRHHQVAMDSHWPRETTWRSRLEGLSAALRLQFSANHSFWNVDLDLDHGAPSRPALFMRSECGVIDYR